MGDAKQDVMKQYTYPDMTKTQTRGESKFILHVDNGSFTDSEIIVLLGENGTGKTTFVRMLAGLLKSDEQVKLEEDGMTYEASQAGVMILTLVTSPRKFHRSSRALCDSFCISVSVIRTYTPNSCQMS